MKKTILFLFIVFANSSILNAQIIFKDQSFESVSSKTNWDFVLNPTTYNKSGDTWDSIQKFPNKIDAAKSGLNFWGMRDLNNGNGGGIFWHTLDFKAEDISGKSNVKVDFYYYSVGYDGTDSIGYVVEYDNSTTWGKPILLDKNTNTWTKVSVDIPAGKSAVRLRLAAYQNGGSDYAGFDNITLSYSASDVTAPTVKSSKLIDAQTIEIVYSEKMGKSAFDKANYTILPSVNAVIASMDSTTATIKTQLDLPMGKNITLELSKAIKDVAGNVLENAPKTINFMYNNLKTGLVITEFLYDSPDGPDNLEFLEIYNNSGSNIEMGGLKFTEGLFYVFKEHTLMADSFLILAKNRDTVNKFFGINAMSWGFNSLSNRGERIILRNSMDDVIDSFKYSPKQPWDTLADHGKLSTAGYSLEFNKHNNDNGTHVGWKVSSTFKGMFHGDSLFASPGSISKPVSLKNTQLFTGKIYPVPATEKLNIAFKNPKNRTIYVYDLKGIMISKSTSNTISTTINTTNLHGFYILKIKENNQVFFKQFMVK